MYSKKAKINKKFIEIVPDIKVRPEYIIKKQILSYNGKYLYKIKVLNDREYEVTEEIFNQIQ